MPELVRAEGKPASRDDSTDRSIVTRMKRFRTNPFSFAHEISLFIRGIGWRAYDNPIGQPVFYPGYTSNVKTAVMASPLLRRKIVELTEERLKVEEKEYLLDTTSPTYLPEREKRRHEITSQLVEITADMLDKMVCKMESKIYIRAAFYGVTQLLTRAYSAIHVSEAEVRRLREVATLAAEKKQSIIFLPRHTSHLDYVTLHLVCYRLGLTLPVVVAGDNLNFPLVGSFLQSNGAMWIRRSFGNDQLYTTLVQAYLDTLLQQGLNLECFIEGGRSRTGKLLGPRFGFLRFLLDSVLSGRTEDAYVCPVSLQYDKVIEVDSYVNELLGNPKQKENLADFISASSVLSLNLGRIDCRFHEPWSLKEFIKEQQARQAPTTLAAGPSSSDSRIRLLRTLGYRVLSDINSASVIMPTALIGTVLLTIRGRGVGKSELIRRVDWLCRRIRANGGKVADFRGMPTSYVVERALEVLGPKLVGTVDGLAEETYYAVDRFQLSFYRNMTIHLFISEALIAAALYTKVKQGGGSANQRMTEVELIDKVTFLSQLFRGEFIFPAGQGLRHNLEQAMQGLVRDDVLKVTEDTERMVGISDAERKSGRENYDLYCFLVWPFVDAAWLGAVSLLVLVPPAGTSAGWVDMQKAQNMAQLAGRTLYHQGDLSYFEAVNKEALKNAYTRFQEEGIIDVAKGSESKAKPTVRLALEWTPERDPTTGELRASGRLWDFIEKIAQFRREGKNRRDGAAVSTRVLSLAARLNQQMFANDAMPVPTGDQKAVKERRRPSKL
ncbi:acetyltransferase [Cladophialophora psammophila CBS 110553]|uniref:Acetyltransferase n=1 Tax=Cladophialophora psammophila CBS 110553 TaxID=1182543 RepID=W9X3J7_9EURO|nr:acetyltransferase [Cladophialophora psammophila CBS 110553]EXJ74778.1 acetyltransferase [Cladophialophora psammophila CBS 110553]